jgi:hypothetical protein
VLALLPHFLAPLSVLGSLAIIYRILGFDRHGIDASNKKTYYRLLAAMCIGDVFGSVAFSFGGVLVPRETLLYSAKGNLATCTAQGFFLHVSVLAVLFYNTGLMICFVMTIRYGWTESYVTKRLEPIIHILSWLSLWAKEWQVSCSRYSTRSDLDHFVTFHLIRCSADFLTHAFRGQSAKRPCTIFCTIPESIALAIIYLSIPLIYCTITKESSKSRACHFC